jgi:tetratricopeptide (TPR) repeat protein
MISSALRLSSLSMSYRHLHFMFAPYGYRSHEKRQRVSSRSTGQRSAGFRSIYLDHQGALELAHGRSERAIEILRQSIASKTNHLPGLASTNGHYTIAQLASALDTVGQFDEAIALLTGVGDRRGEVAAFGTFDSWMLTRARLARLYRKTGNVGKAEGVEAHLLKLLALADPDFPLLKELRARSN